MPQTPYEPESSRNSAKNRVREDAEMLDLPEFDSLPATAGLNNTEAFQLSIRHALALLPALFANIALPVYDQPLIDTGPPRCLGPTQCEASRLTGSITCTTSIPPQSGCATRIPSPFRLA